LRVIKALQMPDGECFAGVNYPATAWFIAAAGFDHSSANLTHLQLAVAVRHRQRTALLTLGRWGASSGSHFVRLPECIQVYLPLRFRPYLPHWRQIWVGLQRVRSRR
jgi:hypothetical protein